MLILLFDSSLDEVTVITMFVTVGFVVVLGFLMHSLVSVESERVMNEQAEQTAKRRRSQASKTGQEGTAKSQTERYSGVYNIASKTFHGSKR